MSRPVTLPPATAAGIAALPVPQATSSTMSPLADPDPLDEVVADLPDAVGDRVEVAGRPHCPRALALFGVAHHRRSYAEAAACGNSCSSSSTGAKRSPLRSTRSSTSAASKRTESGSRAGFERFDLVPAQRRRHPGPLATAQRVDGDGRLRVVVLTPVDQDLALAQLLFLLRDDEVGLRAFQRLRHRLRVRLGLLVGDLRVQRHVDLNPLRARGLGEALEPEVGEERAQDQRHPGAFDDRRRLTGIEIEGDTVGRSGRLASESDGCSSSAAS